MTKNPFMFIKKTCCNHFVSDTNTTTNKSRKHSTTFRHHHKASPLLRHTHTGYMKLRVCARMHVNHQTLYMLHGAHPTPTLIVYPLSTHAYLVSALSSFSLVICLFTSAVALSKFASKSCISLEWTSEARREARSSRVASVSDLWWPYRLMPVWSRVGFVECLCESSSMSRDSES